MVYTPSRRGTLSSASILSFLIRVAIDTRDEPFGTEDSSATHNIINSGKSPSISDGQCQGEEDFFPLSCQTIDWPSDQLSHRQTHLKKSRSRFFLLGMFSLRRWRWGLHKRGLSGRSGLPNMGGNPIIVRLLNENLHSLYIATWVFSEKSVIATCFEERLHPSCSKDFKWEKYSNFVETILRLSVSLQDLLCSVITIDHNFRHDSPRSLFSLTDAHAQAEVGGKLRLSLSLPYLSITWLKI